MGDTWDDLRWESLTWTPTEPVLTEPDEPLLTSPPEPALA